RGGQPGESGPDDDDVVGWRPATVAAAPASFRVGGPGRSCTERPGGAGSQQLASPDVGHAPAGKHMRRPRVARLGYLSCSTDSTLPAGSLNQAIYGPPSRAMPFSSCPKPSYRSKPTPREASSSTASSMLSTGKFRIV